MQRKNRVLVPIKSSIKNIFKRKMFTERRNNFRGSNNIGNRSAFAMIMAVGVIIIVATIMLLSLNTTALTSKRTVDLYLYEQAELHTKSAIEYALYKIARDGCQNDLSIENLDGMYDINISMQYIGTSASGCTDYINNLNTPEQNGSVMMDVTVSVPTSVTGAEPIRFFRRTIQKL
ncbi:MAG: hypothetical protein OQJ77_00890 [Thiovulaceae bacterium]|nr:hypothetical protein [Sulfurimonadaceae bacterium]MCW9025845.1 hypothetical protein [Sulfurimonadaceae bacterium]